MTKTIFLLITLLSCITILSLCFLACGDDDDNMEPTPTPPPDADIIPGYKMHELYLGDPYSTCFKKYGTPLIIGSGVFSNGDCYIIIEYRNLGLMIYITDLDCDVELDQNDIIRFISVLTSYTDTPYEGTTYGGNGLGSSLDSIHEEFGECEEFREFSESSACYYYSIGIDWFFGYADDLDNCIQVWIHAPEPGHSTSPRCGWEILNEGDNRRGLYYSKTHMGDHLLQFLD